MHHGKQICQGECQSRLKTSLICLHVGTQQNDFYLRFVQEIHTPKCQQVITIESCIFCMILLEKTTLRSSRGDTALATYWQNVPESLLAQKKGD